MNEKRGRGRPPKSVGERKGADLRVPVTNEQKELIAEAMRLAGQDMATWARPILLTAAREIVDAAKKTKGRKS